MATRKDFHRAWGPLEMEATVMVLVDYINEIRKDHGKPKIKYQDALVLALNHISHLEPPDFPKPGQ